MLRFLARRTAQAVPALLGAALLVFALIRLAPGDAVEAGAGERGVAPERLAALRADMGLDRPWPEQFADYVAGAVAGDFGVSAVSRVPVLDEFLALFPATVELAAAALLPAVALGVGLGTWAAARRGGAVDHVAAFIGGVGCSLPTFWWGTSLILAFSVGLGWTPVSGRIGFAHFVEPVTGFMLIDAAAAGDWAAFRSACLHLVLPAATLGVLPAAAILRVARAAVLDVLAEDYIRAARARGLSEIRIVFAHALPNALAPIVAVVALQLGATLGGAALTETVFGWPGVGKWLIDSVYRRDYAAVQGGVLLIAVAVIVVNILADVFCAVFDPRMRRHEGV